MAEKKAPAKKEPEKEPVINLKDIPDEFVKKTDFDELSSKIADVTAALTILTSQFSDKNIKAVVSEQMNAGETIKLGEYGNMKLEKLTDTDCHPKNIELEAFMEQVLTIRVDPVRDEKEYEIFPVSVNGKFQPVVRDAVQKVKRKYIEVMARMLETTYVQPKAANPELNTDIINQFKPQGRLICPFIVVNDPAGEDGMRWLDNIMKEAR